MKITIDKTVTNTRAGDRVAFETLLSRYKPMLEKQAAKYLPSLQVAGFTIDDALQDASIAFMRALETYSENKGVTFGAYARRCVSNKLISLCRRAKRRTTIHQHEKTENVARRHAPLSLPDGFADSLTDFERTVYGCFASGFRPSEIAQETGRDVKSVYNALCRIRQKAKKQDNMPR